MLGAATETAKDPLSPRMTYAMHSLLSELTAQLLHNNKPRVVSTKSLCPKKARDARDLLVRALKDLDIPLTGTEISSAAHAEGKNEIKETDVFLQEIAESSQCQDVLECIADAIELGFSDPLNRATLADPSTHCMVQGLKALGASQTTINQLWAYGQSFYIKKFDGGKALLALSSVDKRSKNSHELQDHYVSYAKAYAEYKKALQSDIWLIHVAPLLNLYTVLYVKSPEAIKAKVKNPQHVKNSVRLVQDFLEWLEDNKS